MEEPNYLSYLIGMPLLPAKVMTVFAFAIYVFIGDIWQLFIRMLFKLFFYLQDFYLLRLWRYQLQEALKIIVATYQAADKAGALTLFGIGELGFNSVLSIALASFYGAMAGPTAHMRSLYG